MVEQTGTVALPASGVHFTPGTRATVGRVVHYTSHDTEHETKACRAALVTVPEDDAGRVGLRVFHPTGDESITGVAAHHIDEATRTTEPGPKGRQPGTWHWPERV